MIGFGGIPRWLLRPIGFDPGRSLANAQPSPAEQHAQRIEMWTYVQWRFAEDAGSVGTAKPGSGRTMRPDPLIRSLRITPPV
jgi:hypothetical protein